MWEALSDRDVQYTKLYKEMEDIGQPPTEEKCYEMLLLPEESRQRSRHSFVKGDDFEGQALQTLPHDNQLDQGACGGGSHRSTAVIPARIHKRSFSPSILAITLQD